MGCDFCTYYLITSCNGVKSSFCNTYPLPSVSPVLVSPCQSWVWTNMSLVQIVSFWFVVRESLGGTFSGKPTRRLWDHQNTIGNYSVSPQSDFCSFSAKFWCALWPPVNGLCRVCLPNALSSCYEICCLKKFALLIFFAPNFQILLFEWLLTSSDGDLWPYCITSAVAMDKHISLLADFLDCGKRSD